MIEYVGWFATLLTLSSFVVKEILPLRILNACGAFVWVVYGLYINNNPTVITNVSIMFIHVIWLIKLFFNKEKI